MRTDEYKNIFTHQQTLWWYRGMAEINTRLLKTYLPKKSNNTILDAGCGTGAAFAYLSKFGDVVGVDVSEEALRLAQSIGKVKKSDITSLPFADGTFDVVVCLDVLYHRWVGDWGKAIREFQRVLRPGGILLLREPAYNWMRGAHDKVDFTKHRFTKPEIERELRLNGFRVKKITYANFFLFPLVLAKRFPEMVIQKGKARSDMRSVHPVLNHMLFFMLRLESRLMSYVFLPWGSSLITIAKRQE